MAIEEYTVAWVTKYALTNGVIKVSGKVDHENEISSTVFTYRLPGDSYDTYAHGNDWHRTEQEALERAEKMRARKIASLKKQIAKLEAMKFVVKEK